MRRSSLLAGLLFIAGLPTFCRLEPASAQTPATPPTGEGQNPAPIHALSVDLGGLSNFNSGSRNIFYYRAKLAGELLTQKGTPFTYSDFKRPLPKPDPAKPDGDTPDLSLLFDRGTANIGTGLFDALGVKSFSLPVVYLRDLRGTLQASGRGDGKQFNFAGGVECRPLHPVNLLGGSAAGFTNWVTFGVQGEKQTRDAALGGNQDVALATYRVFIGRGFNWVRSGRVDRTLDKLSNAVLSVVPTYELFQIVIEPLQTKAREHPDQLTLIDRVLLQLAKHVDRIGHSALEWQKAVNAVTLDMDPDLQSLLEKAPTLVQAKAIYDAERARIQQQQTAPDVDETIIYVAFDDLVRQKLRLDPRTITQPQLEANKDAWEPYLGRVLAGYLQPPDQPTYALWIDGAGWYTMAGDPSVRRFQNLLGVTLTWWLKPKEADQLRIQFRYENGFERAAPTVRKHFAAITVGFNFR